MTGKTLTILDLPGDGFLGDHFIEAGKPVLPAVVTMKMLASSLEKIDIGFKANAVINAGFEKFLYPDENHAEATVFMEIDNPGKGARRVKLITKRRSSKYGITRTSVHASMDFAQFQGRPEASLPSDVVPCLEGPIFTVPAASIYRELIPLGPAFRNIEEYCQVSEYGSLARVNGGRAPASMEGSLGSPFPLDAAFHAANLWGQRYAHFSAYPVGFSRRVVTRPTSSGSSYLARVLPRGRRGEDLVFDLGIFTETGEVCEIVEELRMRGIRGLLDKSPSWIRDRKQPSTRGDASRGAQKRASDS